MTDLLGAASRIDDAARMIDRVLATPGTKVNDRALGLDRLTSDLSLQLGAAMPTQLGVEATQLSIPWNDNVVELAKVRTQLAELGAVTRAVHELGGVDHVISQGGLDAIDGAADVIRRHLLVDAKEQLHTASAIIEERPFGISMSRVKRDDHLGAVRRAMAAPMTQLERSDLVDGATDITTRIHDVQRLANSTKGTYEALLEDAGRAIDRVDSMTAGGMPAPSEAWRARMLTSNRARSIHAEQAARATLPVAPRLSTLADDAAVLANTRAALDQHEATFEALLVAVGDARHGSQEYRIATKAAVSKLQRAEEDLVRIEQLVTTSTDPVRDAAYSARDWVSLAASEAAKPTGGFYGNQQQALPTSLQAIRELRDLLAPIADEPELLRAGTDTIDEVKEVLARPGARIDLDVFRSLLDGDTARNANAALVEHLPTIKPHAADTPRTADAQEALRLLDEAGLVGTALSSLIVKGRWIPEARLLDEPGLIEATEELLARADTALGTTALVSEPTARSLQSNVTTMRERVRHMVTESWATPDHYALKGLSESIARYRDELATATERAAGDGGLRAISPSARPAQAAEARGRWMLRELDSLTAPAKDATSAEHIDDAARRATIVHDLLRVANGTNDDTARGALMERAMTEFQSLGETWRMPDDVALDLWRIRDEIQRTGSFDTSRQLSTALPGYNTVPGMDRARGIATGLQAWSMFADGPLPETAADRLSVAARRGAAVRSYLNEMIAAKGEKVNGLYLHDQVEDLRRRVEAVDEIAVGAVPSEVRSRLDELFSSIGSEVERQAAARKKWEDPGAAPGTVWDGASRLDDWVAALEDAHRTARASATEQLAW